MNSSIWKHSDIPYIYIFSHYEFLHLKTFRYAISTQNLQALDLKEKYIWSTITHNYMSAQMHVTKHDYRKLSVSLFRVHPSSACHRSRLQPQPSLFVFLLLPGFDAAPSRSTFSTSSKRPFCSRRRFNSSYAQEGVLTLPTATGQWRYFPIPSPIFLVRWE